MGKIIMTCPECEKEINLVVKTKGYGVGGYDTYRLEKVPQAKEYCDFKEYKEPEYCVACGNKLEERQGIIVCNKCDIKYAKNNRKDN